MSVKKNILTITLLFFTFSAFSQSGNLTIIIKNIKNDKGNIKIALYNEAGKLGFLKTLDSSFRKQQIPINNRTAKAVFKNIPYGIYAVSLFQDENNNGVIDRAPIGFPLEPYGISGNKKTIAPPKFEDGKFLFDKKSLILTIELNKYLKNK